MLTILVIKVRTRRNCNCAYTTVRLLARRCGARGRLFCFLVGKMFTAGKIYIWKIISSTAKK